MLLRAAALAITAACCRQCMGRGHVNRFAQSQDAGIGARVPRRLAVPSALNHHWPFKQQHSLGGLRSCERRLEPCTPVCRVLQIQTGMQLLDHTGR